MLSTNILLQRVVKTLLWCFLFVVGHYYFYFWHIEYFGAIRLAIVAMTTAFFLLGMTILLLCRSTRPVKAFAIEMGCIGLAAMVTMITSIAFKGEIVSSPLLSPLLMIYGNIFAYICMLYPIELLSHTKISISRYILFFLPALALGVLYYVIIYLFALPVIKVNSWNDFLSHIGDFNVWFRFTIFIYPIWLFIVILQRRAKYKQWCEENYSDMKYIDFSWINYYLLGYFLLLCSYIIVILGHNAQSLIMHNICFIVFFAYCFSHVVKQSVPSHILSSDEDAEHFVLPEVPHEELSDCADKYRFIDKIPEHKVALENWMTTDKPYLDKDFRLLDVMNILPLNRSYLSRMFNEAYSETFFCFVMRYRINESTHLLKTRPDLTISRIAEMCGFSSPSVFGRAFLKSEGITPKQYRSQHKIK